MTESRSELEQLAGDFLNYYAQAWDQHLIRIVIKIQGLKYKKSYLWFCIGINLVPYIKGRTQNGGVREKSVEEITFFLAKGKGIGS